MNDWTGNSQAVHAVNQRGNDTAEHDYYATDPNALELLLEQEQFSHRVWEPACGEGHLSKVLAKHEYQVASSDLVDRGYGTGGVDFLKCSHVWDGDIITNPPYKYAKEFVEKSLELVPTGHRVAMFLKLTFLEGQGRRELFKNSPPQVVYVSSARMNCGKNGIFTGTSAVAYCWMIWQKGYTGPTQIKWFN